jgi:hypothetical protein
VERRRIRGQAGESLHGAGSGEEGLWKGFNSVKRVQRKGLRTKYFGSGQIFVPNNTIKNDKMGVKSSRVK